MAPTTTPVTRIAPGVRFRAVRADSNPLWEVKSRKRPGVWVCECIDEPFLIDGKPYPSDFAGERDLFTAEFIAAALRHQEAFEAMVDTEALFWDNVPLGTVLHYHHSFGKWARGRVVACTTNRGEPTGLAVEALVGDWNPYDLPHRGPDGRPAYSSGGHLLENEPWRPHSGNVFESGNGDFTRLKPEWADPTVLPVIDVTIPEPTPERRAAEAQMRTLGAIQKIVEDYQAEPADRLARIAQIVNNQGDQQ
jgi:hypothetical protein